MEFRFHLDPETGLPHLFDHGVTEDEVREMLQSIGEDRIGAEGSRVKVGQTAAGRILKVIYVPDPEPGSVFVVTGYELSGNALKAFRRRQRRRGR
jgi:hypothetical protein